MSYHQGKKTRDLRVPPTPLLLPSPRHIPNFSVSRHSSHFRRWKSPLADQRWLPTTLSVLPGRHVPLPFSAPRTQRTPRACPETSKLPAEGVRLRNNMNTASSAPQTRAGVWSHTWSFLSCPIGNSVPETRRLLTSPAWTLTSKVASCSGGPCATQCNFRIVVFARKG